MKKLDPAGLLGHLTPNPDTDAIIERVVKTRGFDSVEQLKAEGSPRDQRILELGAERLEIGRQHRAELEGWLLLINELVDEVDALKAEVARLRAERR